MSDVTPTSLALNRIADALFAQSKAMSRQVKVAEKQVEIATVMLKLQQQNLATSKALEESLTSQRRAQGQA